MRGVVENLVTHQVLTSAVLLKLAGDIGGKLEVEQIKKVLDLAEGKALIVNASMVAHGVGVTKARSMLGSLLKPAVIFVATNQTGVLALGINAFERLANAARKDSFFVATNAGVVEKKLQQVDQILRIRSDLSIIADIAEISDFVTD